MYFWLRILPTILRALFMKKQPFSEVSRVNLRVWPHETEARYANQAAYPQYLELARWEWVLRSELLALALKQKFLFILGGQLLIYRRPVSRWRKMEIRSELKGWDQRFVYCTQNIYVGNELALSALVKFCCKRGSQLCPPADYLGPLGMPAESPELPPAVQKWIETENLLLKA